MGCVRFGVLGFGLTAWVWVSAFWSLGFGFRVRFWGLGFRVWPGFRVSNFLASSSVWLMRSRVQVVPCEVLT